jgi:hypothetical protein
MSKFFTLISLFFLFSTSAFAQEKAVAAEDGSLAQQTTQVDDGSTADIAVVQILNKTTAKTVISELNLKRKADFSNLAIIAHRCWQAPLDQKPESKMLLEVFETKPNQPEKRIFYGWMFASSPSISGLEHPVYDITALNCKASRK